MRKILIIILFFNFCFSNAQIFETKYSRIYKSSFCGEESFTLRVGKDGIERTDNHYKTTEGFHSRLKYTEFSDSGLYFETWTPGFYLEENGVDDYNRIEKKWYRIYYDKKGGNLLCFLEFTQVGGNLDVENGKFYLTDLGYKIFCTK